MLFLGAQPRLGKLRHRTQSVVASETLHWYLANGTGGFGSVRASTLFNRDPDALYTLQLVFWWCPFILVLKKLYVSNGCKMYLLRSPVDICVKQVCICIYTYIYIFILWLKK